MVANGSGTIASADVTNVAVTCAPVSCGGFFPGRCVLNELTGLLTGECWSVDFCLTVPSCFCLGPAQLPSTATYCGVIIDGTACSW